MFISIVYNSDCMIGMPQYSDQYFDLAICDIPYGIGVGKMAYLSELNNTVRQKNGSKLNANANKKAYTKKEWDINVPGQEYFNELTRVSKHQIIFGIEYTKWTGVGTGRIKWNKGTPEGVGFKKYEVAYCSIIDHEIEIPLLWAGMNQAKTQQGNKKLNEKRIHPTHKPILLYQRLIADYGFPGCRIIDTHVGGGSSRIAADMAGCEYVGYEIDQEYFDMHEKRFNNYKNQLNLFRS